MKVYLAHNFVAQEWLNKSVRPCLEELGIEITSRWLDGHQHKGHDKLRYAMEDLADVIKADLLIYFAAPFPGSVTGGTGKHIELGYAIGLNKQIAIIGTEDELNSVFHWLDTAYGVRQYDTFADLLASFRTARTFKKL